MFVCVCMCRCDAFVLFWTDLEEAWSEKRRGGPIVWEGPMVR